MIIIQKITLNTIKKSHLYTSLCFIWCLFVALWPVFTDVNIWLRSLSRAVMMIVCSEFFFFLWVALSKKSLIQMRMTFFYIIYDCAWIFCLVCCGLYSPTWIFDFRSLSRAVMMIVCSVFFLFFHILLKIIIINYLKATNSRCFSVIHCFCAFCWGNIFFLWPVFTDVNIWLSKFE